MQLAFYFDQTRCTGCWTCVVACKDWNDVPPGNASWMRVSAIVRGKYPEVFLAWTAVPCFHCLRPYCIEACPADAILKRETDGIVVVNREACLGRDACGACRDACPYGAPQFGEEPDARMQKCDFCLERWSEGKKPACVMACPTRALDAGPMEEMEARYGTGREAPGLPYDGGLGPSVVVKAKSEVFISRY